MAARTVLQGLLGLAVALLFAFGPAATAGGRTAVRTYETPMVGTPDNTIAIGGSLGSLPLASASDPDNSFDIGVALDNVVMPGETQVNISARDSTGSRVMAIACQDIDKDGGCSATVGNDPMVFLCTGDGTFALNTTTPVNVLIPMPGSSIPQCPNRQGVTVQGTITLTFS
ncbi:MAG: hypothetical protein ACYDDF_05090 [Thermoplasmatota archaeon]